MLQTLRLRRTCGRPLDAYVERVYSTTSDLDGAIWAWAVETTGRVVGRSQSGASEERTACERRKQRNCRKALVKCSELVMFVTIEKPKDKGVIQSWKDPTRYEVDRI